MKLILHNYNYFMEFMDKLLLPGSGVRGIENLNETLSCLNEGKSVLF